MLLYVFELPMGFFDFANLLNNSLLLFHGFDNLDLLLYLLYILSHFVKNSFVLGFLNILDHLVDLMVDDSAESLLVLKLVDLNNQLLI